MELRASRKELTEFRALKRLYRPSAAVDVAVAQVVENAILQAMNEVGNGHFWTECLRPIVRCINFLGIDLTPSRINRSFDCLTKKMELRR